MEGSNTDEVFKSLFESFLKIYDLNLQDKMKGSDFAFDGVDSLYYDFNKTSINRGGSYIDSPQWLKNKKSTINPKNNDDKCFQYAVTLALNLNRIDNHPERISKIKPFIDQYNWKDIDFLAICKDWKKFESNNEIALNILYVSHNTKKINIAYKSKHDLARQKQAILLMISNGEEWHYLTVKNLSGLLRGITSNHNADFYCLNCFCAYSTKNKLEKHKKICENHDYCHVEVPTKDNNMIKYNHGEKSIKMPITVYADLECLLKKIDTCENDPNKSYTTKINKHIPSGYSIFTYCSFDESKKYSTKIINYEKKKNILLTPEEKKDYDDQKVCYICKKEFDNNDNDKKQQKVRDYCHYTGKYRGAAHNICNLRYKIPKEIPVVFHNGSTYDYHFIIKELAKKFEGNFECLGENSEKYITFSVPMKKKIENKDLEITCKLKFIDSYRFMSSSQSKLVDNLSEGIHNNKCVNCKSNLDYVRITMAWPSALARSSSERKNEKLLLKCFSCDSYYEKKFNKELIKKIKNMYFFCNNNLNKFTLLLRKGVYPYEYMDSWEKLSEISLPSKEGFYSNLNMEDISDID